MRREAEKRAKAADKVAKASVLGIDDTCFITDSSYSLLSVSFFLLQPLYHLLTSRSCTVMFSWAGSVKLRLSLVYRIAHPLLGILSRYCNLQRVRFG
jgi:hypothetical protein